MKIKKKKTIFCSLNLIEIVTRDIKYIFLKFIYFKATILISSDCKFTLEIFKLFLVI